MTDDWGITHPLTEHPATEPGLKVWTVLWTPDRSDLETTELHSVHLTLSGAFDAILDQETRGFEEPTTVTARMSVAWQNADHFTIHTSRWNADGPIPPVGPIYQIFGALLQQR